MKQISRTVAALAAIGLLATAGCGGSGDKSADKDKAASGGTTKTTKVDIHSKVPSGPTGGLKKPRGDRNALQGFKCSADESGAWSATGTLKNSDTSARKYLLSVSVVKAKGNEVLGDVEKTYEVAPGKTASVDLKKVFADKQGAKGRLCVPRVISGT